MTDDGSYGTKGVVTAAGVELVLKDQQILIAEADHACLLYTSRCV